MSGVWELKNGVIRLVEGSEKQSAINTLSKNNQSSIKRVLLHLPTGELVSSYSSLTQMLVDLGWETNDGDAKLLRFSRASDRILLPKDFEKLSEDHRFMIVVKNPDVFQVVTETSDDL